MRAIATITLALLLAAFAGQALAQGNKQLMSERMAQQDLKRNIVEAVIGYKVKSESEFGLTEDAQYRVDSKAAAVIKGIKIDKMIYDRQKDVALCFGHIELGDVVNVLGERISFKNVRVEGFGFGTMTEASRPPLRALRAALLNAYDEMAGTLVGQKILSQSRAENFILTKDSNRAKICAAVFGAYIPNPGLNAPNRGWGWDESGNAFVYLEMDARKVKDLLGNNLVYKGENIISVMGRGAQVDEVSGAGPDGQNPNLVRDPGSKTQYMNLGMPGSTPPAPEKELTGKPAQ
uniref:Penicillin-binding protein activator LpoB n=1 Tax=Fundidesulfovibrio putealis TaxID=270496 RepID=A0A7C4AG26_9BACT